MSDFEELIELQKLFSPRANLLAQDVFLTNLAAAQRTELWRKKHNLKKEAENE